ncbi:MAG: hypothetical protein GX587_02530 [Bacteroidales bacterium]|nr:hypothetical protein [Bacteroidales bacterium]
MEFNVFKEWVFLGLIGILYTAFLFISGIVYRISKSFVSQVNEKMDKLIEEIQAINLNNIVLKKEMEIMQEKERELRDMHKNCENYKPRKQ